MLAFDRSGRRLGYGGGFYDRTLAALRGRHAVQAIGIAYAEQEVEAVPAGPEDARLDGVVTERAYLDFTERSEEHTSELQSLMRISYAVSCLKKKNKHENKTTLIQSDVIIRMYTR